jgi:hypothetical protein
MFGWNISLFFGPETLKNVSVRKTKKKKKMRKILFNSLELSFTFAITPKGKKTPNLVHSTLKNL